MGLIQFEYEVTITHIHTKDGNDMVTLDLNSSGQLFAKSQVTDYMCRGESLANCNMLDFFVDTYEEDIPQKTRRSDNNLDSNDSDNDDGTVTSGRPRHDRIPYLCSHPKSKQKQRVKRYRGHRNLPNFIGRYFPRRDDPEVYPFYCASMLILLKPWRDLHRDLKGPDQSWEAAFKQFLSRSNERTKFILSGIQYFHDCESAAKESHFQEDYNPSADSRHHTTDYDMGEGADAELGEGLVEVEEGYSEEGLAALLASQTSVQEEMHGRLAVEIAKRAKLFSNDFSDWKIGNGSTISNAMGDDLMKLMAWKSQMKQDILAQNPNADNPCVVDASSPVDGSRVEQLLGNDEKSYPVSSDEPEVSILAPESSLPPVHPSHLKFDQFRAYDIITWHLDQRLSGLYPPPLRMILYGEGGTGKSKVIQTTTAAFVQRGAKYMLVKSAYTGVAASLIDGKTTHTLASLRMGKDEKLGDEAKQKLQRMWDSKEYLIIDEYSMISKSFLALLSKNIGIGKQGSATEHPDHSFGGVNVILCGDLHQFPPVAVEASEFLYRPTDIARDQMDTQIGRAIYEEFNTVVILKEQMRVTDPIWRDLLVHLRHGCVKPQHIQILRKLILNNLPPEHRVDFNEEPWASAALVTPRHAVRRLWNESATRKWCRQSGNQLFICNAEDTTQGRPLTLPERYRMAARGKGSESGRRRKRKDLPARIELAIGMKVLVTDNLETDLDITNGARGEIVDIILHPDEPATGEGSIVNLKYLPSYLLVKLSRTRASQLAGLDEAVIPVEPTTITTKISLPVHNGKVVTRTVRRRQYPITAAYAFTDYRSQGQTLPHVIIDIASPPTGTLTLFNLYVALSRSSGRDSIRLLRDFDENLFKRSHDTALMDEDDRLEELNRVTLLWWERIGGTERWQEMSRVCNETSNGV